MKKGKQVFELDKIFQINNKLYNTTSFKKDEFKKIENTCLAESASNKSAIILYQKECKNKNFNPNKKSNITHKNKSKKRNKTLNNTFYKKNNYLKLNNNNHNNNLNNNLLINNKQNFIKKQIKTTNNSSKKYSPNETNKKCKKINNIITGSTNNNITNISVCLTNINMYHNHKNNENFSPSFYKINKKMKQKAKNINSKNKIRSKTYDYPFSINDKSTSYSNTFTYLESKEKEKEKNKTLMEKKMRYFLDYCKDDINSILISQGNLDDGKNIDDNNMSQPKIKKIKSKNKSFSFKNKNRNIHNKYQIDKKKYYINNNKSFNTFNFDDSHISKNHPTYHSHNISTIKNYNHTKTNLKNSLNKNITTKKKPRVDTFEYLAKILNSINTNNLMKSLQKVKENEVNHKNEKKELKCDYFRKKPDIIIHKSINERRFKKKENIKKYIEFKKKLIKKNEIQKKQKEKDDELRKYIELSKLQENIFNSSGNNFNNINNFLKNKSKDKAKKDKEKDNGNNEALYSSESTICDKKNYYVGILDIQNLYNKNNLIKVDKNNDNINYNYNYDYDYNQNYNHPNDKELYIETNSNEIKIKDKEINKNNEFNNNNNINDNLNKIGNDKKDKIELNEIDINIMDGNKYPINNINDKDIYEKCQNTLEKANKIIGGEKVEYLINNFKNIKFTKNSINDKEKDNEKEEEKECLINDFKNDYSFKMNDSNENDMNSYKTSKFYNSQVSSEEKRNDQSDDKNDTIKQNNINERSIKNILDNNENEKYETFKGEEDNTYENNNDINNSDINNENKNNVQNTPSIQLPPTIQLISGYNTLEDKKSNNEQKKEYNFTEEQLEKYKEILSSLNEYLKLITQRNTLNEIITYGDMKYKYKIGIEQLIILIKSMPFNIIRAIQQAQYYNFFFRQLFIPYISRAFNVLKLYSLYHQNLVKFGQKMKNIFKKIILKEIKYFSDKIKKNNEQNINSNKKSDNSNMTIKSLEEISELENLDKNIKEENKIAKKDKNLSSIKSNDKKDENKSKKKSIDNYTEPDISGSKDVDSIDWDNNFINDKQITNRENSKIINSFSKINKKENSYSADFNISIQEIVFDDQN